MVQRPRTLTDLEENHSSFSAPVSEITQTPVSPAPRVQPLWVPTSCSQKQIQKTYMHINTFLQRHESKKADQLRRGGRLPRV